MNTKGLRVACIACLLFAAVAAVAAALLDEGQEPAVQGAAAVTGERDGEPMLVPGGQAFGVKFYTDGVIVVDMTAFETDDGEVNPAFDAGLRVRDVILTINGRRVTTNRDVAEIVEDSGGAPIEVRAKRGETEFTVSVVPRVSAATGTYKIGLWVRDSTAGIGTITYVDPSRGVFGGLGHAIADVDTGLIMPLDHGQVIAAQITGAVKSERGAPGRLKGVFSEMMVFGPLTGNTPQGIFGDTRGSRLLSGTPIAASSAQAHTGDAAIRCTVDGHKVGEFTAVIESINKNTQADSKNLIIRITDPDLIAVTGGIVQGMSGSPIIQDGRLIGAVTHVLVTDPTLGYGIFIENMTQAQGSLDSAA